MSDEKMTDRRNRGRLARQMQFALPDSYLGGLWRKP
jgi:hypothetical protein